MSIWRCPVFLALLLLGGCIPEKVIAQAKDRDLDGYVAAELGGDDCNDQDPTVHPGAAEVCADGIDNNCDGLVDNDGLGAVTLYKDADGDGYGRDDTTRTSCSLLPGWSQVGGVCDDADLSVHPDAQEVCDGIIDDCRLSSLPPQEMDKDGDGYVPCTFAPGTWKGSSSVVGGGDCDDEDDTAYPGAPELCDGVLNACGAGALPEDEADIDGDGYIACHLDARGWHGMGQLRGDDDCDDHDGAVYPGAPELCDGVTDNCSASNLPSNEVDGDGDHYVPCTIDPNRGWLGDSAVIGGSDCDDNDATTYPGAPELCDGVPNACEVSLPPDEADLDGDGYVACTLDGAWRGQASVLGGGDCVDDPTGVNGVPGALIHLGAQEICNNGVDEDCNPATNTRGFLGRIDPTDAAVQIQGSEEYQNAGRSLAAAQVDGTGAEDLVIGTGLYTVTDQPHTEAPLG